MLYPPSPTYRLRHQRPVAFLQSQRNHLAGKFGGNPVALALTPWRLLATLYASLVISLGFVWVLVLNNIFGPFLFGFTALPPTISGP